MNDFPLTRAMFRALGWPEDEEFGMDNTTTADVGDGVNPPEIGDADKEIEDDVQNETDNDEVSPVNQNA